MADQEKGMLPRPSGSSFIRHQLSLEGLPPRLAGKKHI
jgi:hypothetical protein